MVALLSLLAYLLYALWVGRRSLALLAVAGKQANSVNDVIRYECVIDRTLQVRKISGIFPEKFRKVSDILFFRKSYNPTSIGSPAGVSLNTSIQDDSEKIILTTPGCAV